MGRFGRKLKLTFLGIISALRQETHLRIHVIAGLCVNALGLWLGVSRTDMAVLLLACALVITAELVNTALERAVDLTTADIHPLAKTAKDTAAGAVLAAAVFAVITGLLLLGPPLWRIVFG